MTVTAETLALYIRYYLTVTPPLPEQDQRAAQALGRERFEYFIEQLAKRLASGKSLTAEVLDDVGPEQDHFASATDFATISK